MKKLFFILSLATLGFSACNNKPEEVNTLADSLSNVNEGLKMVVSEKDSSIESFIVAFNEIQEKSFKSLSNRTEPIVVDRK